MHNKSTTLSIVALKCSTLCFVQSHVFKQKKVTLVFKLFWTVFGLHWTVCPYTMKRLCALDSIVWRLRSLNNIRWCTVFNISTVHCAVCVLCVSVFSSSSCSDPGIVNLKPLLPLHCTEPELEPNSCRWGTMRISQWMIYSKEKAYQSSRRTKLPR